MTTGNNNIIGRKVRKLLLLMCCTALMATLPLSGCSKKEEPVKKEVVRPARILTIEQTAKIRSSKFPGKVQALDRVELSFELAGKLVELPIREGQRIQKGDLIGSIDPADYQSRLDASQARVNQTKAELDRYENLLQEKVVAKSTYDVMKRNYEVSVADMKIASKALNDTRLVASFSGVIGKRFVDNYQVVQAKQAIVSLQRTSALDIVVNAPEKVMTKNTDGAVVEYEAEFANYPGELFPIKIKEYAVEADPQTQTYRVVFQVGTPKGKTILDGMTATVHIRMTKDNGNSIEIPVQSVFYDKNGQAFVWKTDNDMRLVRSKIKVGTVTNGNIIVLAGLANGERIIISGVQKLKDGMKVREFTGTVGE